MQIPFNLNFLKKIEIAQKIKELDLDFINTLKSTLRNTTDKKNFPTWYLEKKVLYFLYTSHKFYASKIQLDNFTKVTVISKSFSPKITDQTKEFGGHYIDGDFFTPNEIDSMQIRKVFGNLSSRGLVELFEGINSSNQEKFDSFNLTKEGLDWTRFFGLFYKTKKVRFYNFRLKKIDGVKKILKKKFFANLKIKFFYHLFIVALISSAVYIVFQAIHGIIVVKDDFVNPPQDLKVENTN